MAVRCILLSPAIEVEDLECTEFDAKLHQIRRLYEFCVHGIIGARYTGTPHEHDYQETNLS